MLHWGILRLLQHRTSRLHLPLNWPTLPQLRVRTYFPPLAQMSHTKFNDCIVFAGKRYREGTVYFSSNELLLASVIADRGIGFVFDFETWYFTHTSIGTVQELCQIQSSWYSLARLWELHTWDFLRIYLKHLSSSQANIGVGPATSPQRRIVAIAPNNPIYYIMGNNDHDWHWDWS